MEERIAYNDLHQIRFYEQRSPKGRSSVQRLTVLKKIGPLSKE